MSRKSDQEIAKGAALKLNQENAYRVGLELAERIIWDAIKEAKGGSLGYRRLTHRSGRLAWEIDGVVGALIEVVDPKAAGKICAAFNSLGLTTGRDFFLTLPDSERMKGEEHQEGSGEFADVRVHRTGQIALPRGRKQIHTREVLP